MDFTLGADINQVVGKRLREARKAEGLSLDAMAQKVGISVPQLSKLENGKSTASIQSLVKLGVELQRPPHYFLQSDSEMARCLGTLVPSWDLEGRAIEKFAELVDAKTGSKLTMAVFPAAQLGPAGTQIEALTNGVIDVFAESLSFFQEFSDPLRLASLPFCFESESHYERFQASKLFDIEVRNALRSNSVEVLNPTLKWRRGPTVVLISKALITSPDDLAGVPIRCPENDVMFAYLEQLGCQPVVVPWSEVSEAFESGLFDAMITNLSHVISMRFTRFARYMTALDYRPLDLSFAMNKQRYQMLSPSLQDGLNEAAAEAGQYCADLMAETMSRLQELLDEEEAMLTQVSVKPWRAKSLQIFYDLERARFWREGLVREFLALASP